MSAVTDLTRREEKGATPTADALAALGKQMAALEEQIAAVCRQQASLRAALADLQARFPEAGPPAEAATAPDDPALQQCARDVVRVLREVGRPLTPLEILEEMATRHLGWRESAVRHVLADLTSDGVLAEGAGARPRTYALVGRP
jgi:hypothetical protein